MMVLDLKCANDHYFEGWFANMQAFSQQKEAGEIYCPVCENNQVIQVLSPVTIKRPSRPSSEEADLTNPLEQLNRFYKFIDQNFEEVGSEFTKEALKIHYGVTEKRNIRGTSTEDEEKLLKEEGVDFFKFPVPKGDH